MPQIPRAIQSPGRTGSGDAKWQRAALLHRQRDFKGAARLYRELVAERPDVEALHNNLGAALRADGNMEEAEKSFRMALQLNREHVEALLNLAFCLAERREPLEACSLLRQVISLSPDRVEAFCELGVQLGFLGRYRDSARVFEAALRLDPENRVLLANLGAAYTRLKSPGKAVEIARRALAQDPGDAMTLNNIANCLKDQGSAEEALAVYRRALELEPDSEFIRSNLLLTLNYCASLPAEAIAEEHFKAGELLSSRVARRDDFIRDRDPERRLRIGYISPDFRTHSVSYFIQGLLRSHSRSQFEVHCYAIDPRSDQLTALLRSHVEFWHEVDTMSDEEVVRSIVRDGIDILIDLAGHTAGARPGIFARRAAPVQLTYVGYPNTTGLRTMDYRITDCVADPEGMTEHLHTETLVRIPGGFLCYTPFDGAVQVGPPPSASGAGCTFGSLNVLAKLTDKMVGTWSELLHAVPRAQLLLKSSVLGEQRTRDRIRDLFQKRGVAPERLQLTGFIPGSGAHLRYYRKIDVALDPYPYNGTTTTCEALWMGVPVVTLAGRHHASRVGASILTAIGRDEWIARSEEEYVAIACRLASAPAELSSTRFSLRNRMRRSPLMDEVRITREMEAAYRTAWRSWCERTTRFNDASPV